MKTDLTLDCQSAIISSTNSNNNERRYQMKRLFLFCSSFVLAFSLSCKGNGIVYKSMEDMRIDKQQNLIVYHGMEICGKKVKSINFDWEQKVATILYVDRTCATVNMSNVGDFLKIARYKCVKPVVGKPKPQPQNGK